MGLTARVGSTPTSGTSTSLQTFPDSPTLRTLAGPFSVNSDILLGMEIYTAIAATVGAVTGMLAAAASLWNSYQFSVLKGRVDELSAHSTAAYARPR